MSNITYGRQFIDDDDIDAVVETLRSEFLTTGPKVAEFERAVCEFTGSAYAVATSSATAALHLLSLILLEKNDIVLTTPNSFLATSNSILYVGAKPRFVDICEDGNIDLDLCEEELRQDPSIKAIYAVGFSGKMLDQTKLEHLRSAYGVTIIEDLAHALGATWQGIKSASSQHSHASVLSFHPVKHITTFEGGMITTNDEDLYKKALLLRSHGVQRRPNTSPWHYEMVTLGYNYRLSDVAASLGISQLKKLPHFLEYRRLLARRYDEAFAKTSIKPLYPYDENSAYHLYVVRFDFASSKISKEELFVRLSKMGIVLQLHYIPINSQPYYKSLEYGNERTPQMDRYFSEAFTLPLHPSLSLEDQERVIKAVMGILFA